jgi:hypothetical protein
MLKTNPLFLDGSSGEKWPVLKSLNVVLSCSSLATLNVTRGYFHNPLNMKSLIYVWNIIFVRYNRSGRIMLASSHFQ